MPPPRHGSPLRHPPLSLPLRPHPAIAFLIPAVELLLRRGRGGDGVGALVVCPTRELALQILAEARLLLTFQPRLRADVVIGGTNIAKDNSVVNNGITATNAVITSSTLDNTNKSVNNTAIDNSKINSGINATDAKITNSNIVNNNTGVNNTAKGSSTVNSGVNLGELNK